MTKHLFGGALLMCLMFTAGLASGQVIDIDDIQVYTADGYPASPYLGAEVTIEGTVYVVKGTYNSGTFYVQDATGGINIYSYDGEAALGDYVSVTGTVGTYSGEIELIGEPVITVLSPGTVPAPIEWTVGEAIADYENVGWLCAVTGTVITEVGGSYNKYFYMVGDPGDTIQVYVDGSTLIDSGEVAIGDEYKVIGPAVAFDYDAASPPGPEIEVKPRWQGDLIEIIDGNTPPVIWDISFDNWMPFAHNSVTATAMISDNETIVSATLYYRDSDGETGGVFSSVAMTNTSDDEWSGTIPAGHSDIQIDYYIEAVDNGALETTSPSGAPDDFSSIGVGVTSIYEMQYVHPDSLYQSTPFYGRPLNIEGVVTAGYVELGTTTRVIIQEEDPGPDGTYRFGGVLVYMPGGTRQISRGDKIRVGGNGYEFYYLTELVIHDLDAFAYLDFGVDTPTPEKVSTAHLRDGTLDDGNGYLGEAYECVWVKTPPSYVWRAENGYGEYTISSTVAETDTIIVDPWIDLTFSPTVGDVITVEGFMNYNYGEFRMSPIADEYIILTDFTAAPDELPSAESTNGFRSIAPNPFNPQTKMTFAIRNDNPAELIVFNIRGEKVRTLVQERMTAGVYEITWDGTNDQGQTLSSGSYFARLRIGDEVTEVQKLSLVK